MLHRHDDYEIDPVIVIIGLNFKVHRKAFYVIAKSSHLEVFYGKGFGNFAGRHFRRSLLFNKVAGEFYLNLQNF